MSGRRVNSWSVTWKFRTVYSCEISLMVVGRVIPKKKCFIVIKCYVFLTFPIFAMFGYVRGSISWPHGSKCMSIIVSLLFSPQDFWMKVRKTHMFSQAPWAINYIFIYLRLFFSLYITLAFQIQIYNFLLCFKYP